jgi:hypothetical protein
VNLHLPLLGVTGNIIHPERTMTNKIQRTFMLGGAAVVALTVFTSNVRSAAAITMRGATSVTTNMGSLSGASFLSGVDSAPGNMIDRALYVPYTNGVTDQAPYLNLSASNLGSLHTDRSSKEWFSAAGVTSGNVTFNLGAVYNVANVVLWNEDTFGIRDFDIFASNNASFASATNLGSFRAFNQFVTDSTAPQFIEQGRIFGFTPTAAQFIRLVIKNTYGYDAPNRDFPSAPRTADREAACSLPTPSSNPLGYCAASIGEVAFGVTDVPTPALLPGLIGLGVTAWRKRRQLAE